jgi:HPt (histidine-containing phosphotransfer) domain-containing protein
MRDVLEDYVARLPTQVARLNDLWRAGSLAELRRIVHQMKGAGGGYGFPDVTRLAARAEDAIKAEAPAEAVLREVEALVELVRRVEGYRADRENSCDAEVVAHR